MSAEVSRRFDPVVGHETLVLENQHVRVVVLPSLGGRVWEVLDKNRGRQWVWHRWQGTVTAPTPTDSYDDVWAGGWEELFPNDAPTTIDGRLLKDHGEWWRNQWRVESMSSGDSAHVTLSLRTETVAADCRRTFSITGGGSAITVAYEIKSDDSRPFSFLFKQHFPVALTLGCRLLVPGGYVEQVDPSFGNLLGTKKEGIWPMGGGPDASFDLQRVLPASSLAREFVYVSDLKEPWCGIDDHESGASLRMYHDESLLPFVWLFITYGGWRDCYTVVLEACTNKPKELEDAIKMGTSATLFPGETFRTSARIELGGV